MVLVVEDNPDLRELFVEVLLRAGFGAFEAGNGHEAVVKATAMRPDLIVLDLSLPLLGGGDTLRVLRSNAATRDTLVIALARDDESPEDLEGFDGVLRKPCAPTELLFAVQGLLALARRASTPSR